jgi:SAM-dependent methyltransferase
MTAIHEAAARGFSNQAQAYVRGRPGYPAELGGWLRDVLGLVPGKSVVDLGAGTGKITPLLLSSGASVIAVEPVAAMRAQLSSILPEVHAVPGRAESMPLADASVDAVICAQAFHWFSTIAAMEEIRRVLKPGGWLGLIWNVRDESVPWVAALTDLITPYEGSTPRFSNGDWKKRFPAEGLGPLGLTRFSHIHTGPPQQVIVDRTMSVSFIAALPQSEQDEVRARLHDLIATDPALRRRDEVSFPYSTEAYCCERLQTSG